MKIGFRIKAAGNGRLAGYTARLIVSQVGAEKRVNLVSSQGRVEEDGAVTIDAGQPGSETAPAVLTVTGPDGAVVYRRRATLEELAATKEILVRAAPQIDLAGLRPVAADLRRFRGRLICESKQAPAGGVGVTVAVQRKGSAVWMGLISAVTDADGRFTGLYQPGAIESARLRIGATEVRAIPVKDGELETGLTYWARVTKEEVGCCAGQAPRAPDAESLAEGGGTYSQDLCGDSCVDFRQKPDRTLQEMRYWAVVRTTSPDVRTIPAPQRGGAGYSVVAESGGPQMTNTLTGVVVTLGGGGGTAELERFLDDYEERPEVSRAIEWESPVEASTGQGHYWGQADTVSFGHILGFKQSWHADGYSLGELVYSLPLAPGQKKRVAIVDWGREDRGEREESRTYEESLSADLAREREIAEGMASAVDEVMAGGSKSKTYSASASAGLFGGGGFLGVSGGYSGASSSAWQDSARQLTAQFSNSLRDGTMQAQSALRRQRVTVVETLTQKEDMRVETEVVANYNHCHAMTVEYFQVLRHFVVRQQLETVRECVFVPMSMMGFDHARAYRFREELKPALLDRELREAFRALERKVLDKYDPPSQAQRKVAWVEGELELVCEIPRPEDGEDNEFKADYWKWFAFLVPFYSARELHERYIRKVKEKDRSFRENILPVIHENVVERLRVWVGTNVLRGSIATRSGNRLVVRMGPDQWNEVSRKQMEKLTIRVDAPATAAQGISWLGENAKVRVERADFRFRYDGETKDRMLVSSRVERDVVETFGKASTPRVKLHCPVSSAEEKLYSEQDATQVAELVRHLNANLEYYHRAIWMRMDPQRRYMMLDRWAAPHTEGRSIAAVVDNVVVGVVGNCLVMPVAPGVSIDPRFRGQEDREALKRLYDPPDRLPAMRFTAPTKGVFAEAVLGHCNSCERKDETRFWRWEESPIPDEATSIAEVDAGSRNQANVSTKATEFPQPIVQVQNAPAAPDPTGLAGAIAAMSQPFGDMTGLSATQANAAKALEMTLGASQTAALKASELLTKKMENEHLPSQLGEIEKAYERNAISEELRQKLTAEALGRAVGLSGTGGETAALPPEVTGNLGGRDVTYKNSATGVEFESSPAAEGGGEDAASGETKRVLITVPEEVVGQGAVLRLASAGQTSSYGEAALTVEPNRRRGFEADIDPAARYTLTVRAAGGEERTLFADVAGAEMASKGFRIISKIGGTIAAVVKALGGIVATGSGQGREAGS